MLFARRITSESGPTSLKQQLMEERHAGVLAGHFSGPRLFKMISRKWWWNQMYKYLMDYARSCPQVLLWEGQNRNQFHP